MAATADPPEDGAGVDDSSLFYDTWLDWLVAGLLVLEGLVATWLGVSVVGDIGRAFAEEFAAEFFASPDASSFPLTEPELADVVYTVGTWAGWGVVLTGLVMVAAGIWFWRYRQGVRERLADGHPAPRWHAPLLGGLLATALLFVPFVQVLGGAVAGYLSDRSAIVDGVLAGVVFGAPAYVLWAAVVTGTFASGVGGVGVLMLIALVVYVLFDVVLGAVGGLVGGLLS
jgi:hypothetical protein